MFGCVESSFLQTVCATDINFQRDCSVLVCSSCKSLCQDSKSNFQQFKVLCLGINSHLQFSALCRRFNLSGYVPLCKSLGNLKQPCTFQQMETSNKILQIRMKGDYSNGWKYRKIFQDNNKTTPPHSAPPQKNQQKVPFHLQKQRAIL